MESCATRICLAMQLRNMRQVDLSIKTGIPKSAISQYCSGSFNPKQKRLFLIAQALNVDEAWLMGLDVPMERTDGPSTINNLSVSEQDLVRKFRKLDDRGKATVINALQHEYTALSQTVSSESSNIARSYPLRPDRPSIDLRVASPIKLPALDNHKEVEDK